ncbi:MAG: hypothetical protein H0V33_09185 [Acidimicrobiia bacterium]|nr:hypothetical protein [Acidimicrobiia bacterium]
MTDRDRGAFTSTRPGYDRAEVDGFLIEIESSRGQPAVAPELDAVIAVISERAAAAAEVIGTAGRESLDSIVPAA